MHKKALNEELSMYKKSVQEHITNKKKLTFILGKVNEWIPPVTPDYKEFKKFMIEQLTSTIEQDGNYSYYTEHIIALGIHLNNINPIMIRAEIIEDLNLSFYEEQLQKQKKSCEESNEWVRVLLKSLKTKK
jgi:hypothetical protein